MTDIATTRDTVYQLYVLKGCSRAAIFKHFEGRFSKHTIQTYIAIALKRAKEEGTPLAHRPAGGATASNNSPLSKNNSLSQAHRNVGAALLGARVLKHDETPSQFCERTKFGNHVRLRYMEMGSHDFTLSELLRIRELLGVTLDYLVAKRSPSGRTA